MGEWIFLFLFNSQENLAKYSGISIKQTPLVQEKSLLYRDVHFIKIFSKIVWLQSKAIRIILDDIKLHSKNHLSSREAADVAANQAGTPTKQAKKK